MTHTLFVNTNTPPVAKSSRANPHPNTLTRVNSFTVLTNQWAFVRPVVSPGPGPATRKPHVPYRLQRKVSSHWCSTSKTWWNPCGGQLRQNVATRDPERGKEKKSDLRAANFVSPHISNKFLTCLFRPGSGDTSWKTATRPDAVPTATRSSKQLSSFTAVMASLLPWKHTRVETGCQTGGR